MGFTIGFGFGGTPVLAMCGGEASFFFLVVVDGENILVVLCRGSLIYPLNSSQSLDYNPQLYFGSIFNPEFYKSFGIGPSTLFLTCFEPVFLAS
jgi:hypothetical protein